MNKTAGPSIAIALSMAMGGASLAAAENLASSGHSSGMVQAVQGVETTLLGQVDGPVDPVVDAPPLLGPSDAVVLLGSGQAERVAMSGFLTAVFHAAYPEENLVVRSLAWTADEVGRRPRERNVPKIEDHLRELQPRLVLMAYGAAEAWAGPDGIDQFQTQLRQWVSQVAALSAEGVQIVLIAPHTNWAGAGDIGLRGAALEERRANLALYRDAMAVVAAELDLPMVDLLSASEMWDGETLSNNGLDLNAKGAHWATGAIARALALPMGEASSDASDVAEVLDQAIDLEAHWQLVYRPMNTEYVFGRRHTPFGVVNFPPELLHWRAMTIARDTHLSEMVRERGVSVADLLTAEPERMNWPPIPRSGALASDAWAALEVEARGRENSLGSVEIADPDDMMDSFTLADGYVIECFASELDFPELANPMAMNFDAQHRLWLLVSPSYPHLLPGDAPSDKLLIIEDTDGDGRADKSTVFAEGLHCPMGFAVEADGSVYVGQAPYVIHLTDEDGDSVADRSEIVVTGFGMPDSHHQISAMEWGPDGTFLLHEGTFTRSGIETPFGLRRTRDAAIWRFDPRTQRSEVLSHCYYANPWGHVFDDWGMSVLTDASGGDNWSFSQVISAYDGFDKPRKVEVFANRGRPIAGNEIIASRHFPEDVQGTFLVNQVIGFHGTRWNRMIEAGGSSWRAEPKGNEDPALFSAMPQDLVSSNDTNYRPVAMEMGPDGALYIADWSNPLIGHMQYSVRDPRRDHSHGRVWRVRHAERPLLEPPTIVGASVDEWLELLKLPERNTRQLARRQLQMADAAEVFPALTAWLARQSGDDPLLDRYALESLWLHQAHGRMDLGLLEEVMTCATPQARAGATRVLRHWLQAGEVDEAQALRLLAPVVTDSDMRVRLEGVVACGFARSSDAAAVAALAGDMEMDAPLRFNLEQTLKVLGKYGDAGTDIGRRFALERAGLDELLTAPMDSISAQVRLMRSDVPIEAQREGLAFLESEGAEPLASLIQAAITPGAGTSTVALILEQSPETLAENESALRDLMSRSTRGVRLTAAAGLIRGGVSVDTIQPARDAVAALATYGTPADVDTSLDALKKMVQARTVDPAVVFEAVARSGERREEAMDWMAALVRTARDTPMSAWSHDHLLGMAASRALHQAGPQTWPSEMAELQARPVDPQRIARGAELFNDAENGCARCHGDDGRGAEGFPGLVGSRRLLGDPVRAASIVVYGLHGEIESLDGLVTDSAMAPLGALLNDQEISDALTYARRAWGNFADPVRPDAVFRARAQAPEGKGMWTPETLAATFPIEGEMLSVVNASSVTGGADGTSMSGTVVGLLVMLVGMIVVLGGFILIIAKMPSGKTNDA